MNLVVKELERIRTLPFDEQTAAIEALNRRGIRMDANGAYFADDPDAARRENPLLHSGGGPWVAARNIRLDAADIGRIQGSAQPAQRLDALEPEGRAEMIRRQAEAWKAPEERSQRHDASDESDPEAVRLASLRKQEQAWKAPEGGSQRQDAAAADENDPEAVRRETNRKRANAWRQK